MNADPRRPDKIQRYAPNKNNANGDDLTPDYMNIMGQPPTTANAAGEPVEKHQDTNVEPILHARPDDVQLVNDELAVSSNAANVIPTSSQYGVAIIPTSLSAPNSDLVSDTVPISSDNLTEAATKTDEAKDLHTTPSRNDRFKVVKIASLEPFKRGRWKCMDYVDEAPPPNVVIPNVNKAAQSVGATIQGGVYLQTQSLPQQQIQQMLLQGGFTNGAQFFPNMPAHLIPQGQFFYPQVANVQSQTVSQQVATSMPTQFINNQPYFAAGVVTNAGGFTLPQSYPNIQYVPIPAPGSAFVPTTQAVHLPASFQQSQTYAGQPTASQANLNQSMVNGHAFPQQSDQPVQGSQLPNQPAKNVIVVNSQPVNTHGVQNHQAQSAAGIPAQQYHQQQSAGSYPQQQIQPNQTQGGQIVPPIAAAPTVIAPVIGQHQQGFDASNVYTNPQFTMSVPSLTVLDSNEINREVPDTNSAVESISDNAEDPTKNNPVVNAIDNKIEQAMDLVKSHLMYTLLISQESCVFVNWIGAVAGKSGAMGLRGFKPVREEVEVLKEKIAELMEKIQQLETENNYLRAQIPKNQGVASPAAPNASFNQPQNIAVVNPSPNVMPQSSNPMISNASVSAPTPNASNQSQAIPNSTTVHQTGKEAPSLQ
ncbi:hypothetical protein HUJ05_007072 [Dendroctonus ponderosae]|nr:hypothetical protein HUJ05_007072 [Dendroctonus ponderosae]